MPEKDMREHTTQHVMLPASIFAHFIVIHPQLGVRCLITLFNGPTNPASPDEGRSAGAERRVAHVIPRGRLRSERALHHEPDSSIGEPMATERHEPFREVV